MRNKLVILFILLGASMAVLSIFIYQSVERQQSELFVQEQKSRITTALSFLSSRLVNIRSNLGLMEEIFIPSEVDDDDVNDVNEEILQKIFKRLAEIAPNTLLVALDTGSDEEMLVVKRDDEDAATAMFHVKAKLHSLRAGGEHGVSFVSNAEHQYVFVSLGLKKKSACLVAIFNIEKTLRASPLFSGVGPYTLIDDDGTLLFSSQFESLIGMNVKGKDMPAKLRVFEEILNTDASFDAMGVYSRATEGNGGGILFWGNVVAGVHSNVLLVAFRPNSLIAAPLMFLRNWILALSTLFLILPGALLAFGYVKKSKEASHTREVLEFFTQVTGDSCWEYNLKNGNVLLSSNVLDLFGDGKNPTKIARLQKSIHPDDLPIFMDALKKVFKKERTSIDFEVRFKAHDGSYKWIWERGSVLGNALVGIGTDVDERRREMDSLEHLSAKQHNLLDIFSDTSQYENLGQLLKALDARMSQVVGYSSFGLAVFDYLGKDLLYDTRFLGELMSMSEEFSKILNSGHHYFSKIMKSGMPIVSGDVAADEGIVLQLNKDAQSALGVPLTSLGGRKWGAIGLAHRDKNAFSLQDVDLMRVVASYIVRYLEESSSKETIKEQLRVREMESMVDSLTKIWNRRYLERRMEEEGARIERNGGTACICLGDVGEFKKVNDNFGHEMGDEVLKAIAKCLTEHVRETDVAARLGGDEFVLLLSNLGENEVHGTLERIQNSLAQTQLYGTLPNGAIQKIKILIDFGAQFYPNDGEAKKLKSLAEAMRLADEAMYEKKQARKRAQGIGAR